MTPHGSGRRSGAGPAPEPRYPMRHVLLLAAVTGGVLVGRLTVAPPSPSGVLLGALAALAGVGLALAGLLLWLDRRTAEAHRRAAFARLAALPAGGAPRSAKEA